MFMDGTGSKTENFEDAIRSYVKTYEFGNAEQTDLYEQLNKVISRDKGQCSGM